MIFIQQSNTKLLVAKMDTHDRITRLYGGLYRVQGSLLLDAGEREMFAGRPKDAMPLECLPFIRCPICGKSSIMLDDILNGYCGRCHDWTGSPRKRLGTRM